ncbi:site-specific integrase [Maribacter litoralis]|uniref:site-specific integrase n=1 Tax=Maribacter litoralis TaxID=2059726 RepID=UPI003F5CDB1B
MKNVYFTDYLSPYLVKYLPSQKGLSTNTTSSYAESLSLFIKYLEEYKNIDIFKLLVMDITREIVIDFLEYLQEVRKNSNSTRNLRLSAIQSFY